MTADQIPRKFFQESEQSFCYDARYFRTNLPLPEHQERLRQLLATLPNLTQAFFLDFGSLLGAYRTGDMIPWDDDIDVGILIEDLLALPTVCRVTPDTIFEINPNTRIGPYDEHNRVNARLICTRTGAYLDIFAYWQIEPGMAEPSLASELNFTCWERIGLQLPAIPADILRPFGSILCAGEMYNAPQDTRTYLQLTYGEDLSPDHLPTTGPDGQVHYLRIR